MMIRSAESPALELDPPRIMGRDLKRAIFECLMRALVSRGREGLERGG